MARNKPSGRKRRLIARAKVRAAPRWVDIKKYGLKRARTRRVRVRTHNWRRDRLKV
ncbi:MAG: 50S ribosomal protein L39e [Candidatus Aenigmarchaeota archaeon]|nr:50S ribosomal protein L39e [Candidatus Aenigmarchaeota archaeon]